MKQIRNLFAELASASCMLSGNGSTLDEADKLAEELKKTYRNRIEALGYYLDAQPIMKDVNGTMLCHSLEAIIYPQESLANPDEDDALKNACFELPDLFKEKPVVISYSPITAAYWLRSMR